MDNFEILSIEGLVSAKEPLNITIAIPISITLSKGSNEAVTAALKEIYGAYTNAKLNKTDIGGMVQVTGTITQEVLGWVSFNPGHTVVIEMPPSYRSRFPEWMK